MLDKRQSKITLIILAFLLVILMGIILGHTTINSNMNNVWSVGIGTGQASPRVEVEFVRHVDGDTTYFLVDGEVVKVRYLVIDTDEIFGPRETELGHMASAYVKKRLLAADKIELEFDDAQGRIDSYGRTRAWVWLDDELLQYDLVKAGLARIHFYTGNEQHLEKLQQAAYRLPWEYYARLHHLDY